MVFSGSWFLSECLFDLLNYVPSEYINRIYNQSWNPKLLSILNILNTLNTLLPMAITKDISHDDFNTKVWLITGTSSGMGRELVRSALSRNDKVIATARVLEQIQDLHSFADTSRLYLMQLDITDSQDIIDSKVAEAIAVWGRIDILVNNAGTGVKMILEEGG